MPFMRLRTAETPVEFAMLRNELARHDAMEVGELPYRVEFFTTILESGPPKYGCSAGLETAEEQECFLVNLAKQLLENGSADQSWGKEKSQIEQFKMTEHAALKQLSVTSMETRRVGDDFTGALLPVHRSRTSLTAMPSYSLLFRSLFGSATSTRAKTIDAVHDELVALASRLSGSIILIQQTPELIVNTCERICAAGVETVTVDQAARYMLCDKTRLVVLGDGERVRYRTSEGPPLELAPEQDATAALLREVNARLKQIEQKIGVAPSPMSKRKRDDAEHVVKTASAFLKASK
jgi:hypothetical protein